MRTRRYLSRLLTTLQQSPPSHAEVFLGTQSAISRHRYFTRWVGGGIIALMLLSILIGRTQEGVAARAPARSTTAASGHWANLFPALRAISAVSPTEFWAAGEGGHVLHYQEGIWTRVDPPLLYGAALTDISMSSPTQGWVLAGGSSGTTRAFSYDGNTWQEHSEGLSTQGPLAGLAAVSPTEAWAISRATLTGPSSNILHWTGGAWTTAVAGQGWQFSDLAMRSPTDGWATGYSGGRGGVYQSISLHWDGTSWAEVPTDTDTINFDHISFDSTGTPWVVGNPYNNTGRAIYSYHADQGGWSTGQVLPQGTIPTALYMKDASTGWLVTSSNAIWIWNGITWAPEYDSPPITQLAGQGGQVWAVGDAATVLSRPASGLWTLVRSAPTTQPLYAFASPAPGEVWAVGASGTIVHGGPAGWAVVSSPVTTTLSAVVFASPAEGYAVGTGSDSGGVILRWDGQVWTLMQTTPTPLHGLALTGPGSGWAVGDGGQIWHLVAGQWQAVATSMRESLNAITMNTPTHGWIVGGTSIAGAYVRVVLLEYNGTTWTPRGFGDALAGAVPSSVGLSPDGREGWATGRTAEGTGWPPHPARSTTLRWADGTWSEAQDDNLLDVDHVAMPGDTTAWATGTQGFSYYDGSTWQIVTPPADPWLTWTGLTFTAQGAGWATGPAGRILAYEPAAPIPTPTLDPAPPAATATATATATGIPPLPACGVRTTLLAENFENGWGTFTTTVETCDPATCGWQIRSEQSHSSTHSVFARDIPQIGDQGLVLSTSVSIPADAAGPTLEFWQALGFDSVYDGGVLELSVDNGANWIDAGPYLSQGGYNGALVGAEGNPLGPRPAWVGGTSPWTFTRVTVNLQAFAGQALRVRWRLGTGAWIPGAGWWIDDVQLTTGFVCATGTPSAQPTGTASPTPTSTATRLPAATVTPEPTLSPSTTPQATAIASTTTTATRTATVTPPAVGSATATPTCGSGGTWVRVPSADPDGVTDLLYAVATVGPTQAWAVGYRYDGTTYHTLSEHWDGNTWMAVPNPMVGTGFTTFTGVAGTSPTDVWAVGYAWIDTTYQALIEHWNGTTWTVVPQPQLGTGENVLRGVTAFSAADVWAVGDYVNGSQSRTLILHWDGTAWNAVAHPDAGYNSLLYGIAGAAATDLWAVGSTAEFGAAYQTLTLHWDGTAWTVIPSPNPGPQYTWLYSVTANGAGEAWAVGRQLIGNAYQAVQLHWDGTAWHLGSEPALGGLPSELYGVAAAGATPVWAVGTYGIDGNQNLIERWDGTEWTLESSPPARQSTLYGIARVGPDSAWAVGQEGTVDGFRTLILRYQLCGSPTATATSTPIPSGTLTPSVTVAPSSTPTRTATASASPPPSTATPSATVERTPTTTSQATGTPTATSSATSTPCPVHFSDLTDPQAYYYAGVYYLACRGVVGGYADGTYRPFNNTTRGQLAKIVTLGYALAVQTPAAGSYTFTDVLPGSTFFPYVETVAARWIVGGYACGHTDPQTGQVEPCDPQSRPYYRPGTWVTRGQLTRIVVGAAIQVQGWSLWNPATPHFSDVLPGSTFYPYIETAVCHGVLGGYADGTFRPANNATRGQIAKIITNGLTAPTTGCGP